MKDEETKKKDYTNLLLVIILIIILFVFFGSGYYMYCNMTSTNRGTFGDMFGAVNALFSGLALFGIIVTLYMQRKDLNLQKEEMKLTRKEFEINRITNIILRKTEYLNIKYSQINLLDRNENEINLKKLLFQFKDEKFDSESPVDKLRMNENIIYNSHLINNNISTLDSLVIQIKNDLDSIERVKGGLSFTSLESYELRNFYKTSIDTEIEELLFRISILPKRNLAELYKSEKFKNANFIITNCKMLIEMFLAPPS